MESTEVPGLESTEDKKGREHGGQRGWRARRARRVESRRARSQGGWRAQRVRRVESKDGNECGNRGMGWRARRAKAEEGVGVGGEHRGQGLGEHGGQGRSRARRARSVESTEGKEGGEHGGQARMESTVANNFCMFL